MAYKIYFPRYDYLSQLVGRYVPNQEYELVEVRDDSELIELLNENKIDLALVDPLIYSQIESETDYAVVPTAGIFAIGFTRIATIYFSRNLREISNLAYSNIGEYFHILAKLILFEKYDFEIETTKILNTSLDDLKNYNAILTSQKFDDYPNSLDLTEEWFDAFEFPLPIAFWIAAKNHNLDELVKITQELLNSSEIEDNIYEHHESQKFTYDREGSIIHNMTQEGIQYIEEIIQLFYEIGLIDNMKDVRVLGSEE